MKTPEFSNQKPCKKKKFRPKLIFIPSVEVQNISLTLTANAPIRTSSIKFLTIGSSRDAWLINIFFISFQIGFGKRQASYRLFQTKNYYNKFRDLCKQKQISWYYLGQMSSKVEKRAYVNGDIHNLKTIQNENFIEKSFNADSNSHLDEILFSEIFLKNL